MSRLVPYLDALRAHYGPPPSPAPETPFEPFVRAILAPGASAPSLEKAIHTMRVYGMLDLAKIRDLDPDTIALAIKPVGRAHAKAGRLKTFAGWLVDRFAGDGERLKGIPPHQLRDDLMGIGGFGPESADLILQRALGFPVAVVDLPTYRVLTRHELAVEEAGYEDLKEVVEKDLPRERFGEFHDLVDRVGRDFCRPKARCEGCPLKPFLPPGK